ncbi:hypothetical protein ABW20_dc0109942 [Dactylellina cionopaga]|nr:hypothetical protein ABW20_dc0109942 [Dactylellina cionopaga]
MAENKVQTKLNSQFELLALPTEICTSIASFLTDSGDKKAFATCSRYCYLLAFPIRFRGVKITDCQLDRALERFDDGECMASVRHNVRINSGANRSARFNAKYVRDLPSLLPNMFRFTNITSLIIDVPCAGNIERNLYVAALSLFSTLPYYDSLEHIAVEWSGPAIPVDSKAMQTNESEDEAESRDFQRRLSETRIEKRRCKTYNSELAELSQYEKDFLRPFIPREDFIKAASNEIRLPKRLESFKIGTSNFEAIYLLPLLRSKTVNALCLHEIAHAIMDPHQPATILEFPGIKTLTLSFENGYWGPHISHLPKQYPNLESLTVIALFEFWPEPEDIDLWGTSQLPFLPNLPNLTYLEIPWPLEYNSNTVFLEHAEHSLKEWHDSGAMLALRTLKLVVKKQKDEKWDKREAVCTISTVENPIDRYSHSKNRIYNWEGDTLAYRNELTDLEDKRARRPKYTDSEDEKDGLKV